MKPKTIRRPWGSFRQFTHGELSTIKIITVNPGQAFSLQYHKQREEFWHILSGQPCVTIGRRVVTAKPGQEFFIGQKVSHRVVANKKPAVFLEIAFGKFAEKDIVRLEDRYGRT